MSLHHKHVISFIETFEQNGFRIRKLIPANEAHSAPSVTGGEDRRLVTRGQITSLLAAPHYHSHCKKTRQEGRRQPQCTRRWQQEVATGAREGAARVPSKYDRPACPHVCIMTQAETSVEETVMADGMRGNGGARGATCETCCYKWFLRITISSSWAWIRASYIATLRQNRQRTTDLVFCLN